MALAHLALADGFLFSGQSLFRSNDIVVGEVVFSTATCGYTEILTDPSYVGQIVVLANPEVGNYGVSFADFQSTGIKVKGLVVRQLSLSASSWRADLTLRDWLMRENVPVLMGVDTRAIIAHIREKGAMMAAMAPERSASLEQMVSIARSAEPMNGLRLSHLVSVQKPQHIKNETTKAPLHVVVLDFGIKQAIIDNLLRLGVTLTLLPGQASVEEILAHVPDGLFLSNGPGDPKTEDLAIETVRRLLGKVPIFGVCLGHQILAQALGETTFKLKYGHRGSNQAVRCRNGALITTAQNHGFAVDLAADDTRIYAINISDGTNEGIHDANLMAFSVQFHPEGAPGPLDGAFYFQQFIEIMLQNKDGRASKLVDESSQPLPC